MASPDVLVAEQTRGIVNEVPQQEPSHPLWNKVRNAAAAALTLFGMSAGGAAAFGEPAGQFVTTSPNVIAICPANYAFNGSVCVLEGATAIPVDPAFQDLDTKVPELGPATGFAYVNGNGDTVQQFGADTCFWNHINNVAACTDGADTVEVVPPGWPNAGQVEQRPNKALFQWELTGGYLPSTALPVIYRPVPAPEIPFDHRDSFRGHHGFHFDNPPRDWKPDWMKDSDRHSFHH